MPACIAEHAHEYIGAAVDDFGLIAKAGCGIDEAAQFDNPGNTVEIAARRGFDPGDQIEAAEPRRLAALLDREVGANLPQIGAFAIPLR